MTKIEKKYYLYGKLKLIFEKSVLKNDIKSIKSSKNSKNRNGISFVYFFRLNYSKVI